eukprot:symbB.v1.2.036435.t1/scaffold5142.1/size30458/2
MVDCRSPKGRLPVWNYRRASVFGDRSLSVSSTVLENVSVDKLEQALIWFGIGSFSNPACIWSQFCWPVCFTFGQRSGIFHYMFLDNRFKYEPLALIMLLLLLALVYSLGSCALNYASTWPARIAIVLAALGTCTWTPGKMEDNDSKVALLAS